MDALILRGALIFQIHLSPPHWIPPSLSQWYADFMLYALLGFYRHCGVRGLGRSNGFQSCKCAIKTSFFLRMSSNDRSIKRIDQLFLRQCETTTAYRQLVKLREPLLRGGWSTPIYHSRNSFCFHYRQCKIILPKIVP